MKDSKRNILKQLMNGEIKPQEATAAFKEASTPFIVFKYPDGSYAAGEAGKFTLPELVNGPAINEAQMLERTKYARAIMIEFKA